MKTAKEFLADLEKIERVVEEKKSELKKLEGREQEVLTQLKEFDISTVAEADEKIAECESVMLDLNSEILKVETEIYGILGK